MTSSTAAVVREKGGTAVKASANALGQEVSLDLMRLLFGRRTVKEIIESDTVPACSSPAWSNCSCADTEAGRAIKPVVLY
jgi:hypothetical protein